MKVPASIELNQIGSSRAGAPVTPRQKAGWKRLLLALASTLLSLLVCEIGLRLLTRCLPAFEADYVWNRYFLESQRCAQPNALERYPGNLAVFDPPVVSLYPLLEDAALMASSKLERTEIRRAP